MYNKGRKITMWWLVGISAALIVILWFASVINIRRIANSESTKSPQTKRMHETF